MNEFCANIINHKLINQNLLVMKDEKKVSATAPRGSKRAAKRVTMTDIATQAGVSQSTVSLVLNAMTGAKLSEETRQKVLRIALESGYRLPEGRKSSAQPGPVR